MADDFTPDASHDFTPDFEPDKQAAPGLVESALKPITDIPSTFMQMERDAAAQVGRGYGQIGSMQPWEMAKGAGNVLMGGLGELTAPINAPLKTFVGDPTEQAVTKATGSPGAGQIAGAITEAGAGFMLPAHLPRMRAAPKLPGADPYGVTLSEGERAGDIGMRAKEQAAVRASQAPDWVAQREAQIDAAREDIQRGFDPVGGQIVANTPTEAGQMVSQGVRTSKADAKAGSDALYQQARTMPGEIHAGTFEGMPQSIKGDLTLGDQPVIVDNLTPQASRMLDYLDGQIGNLKIKNKADPFGPPNPENIVGINLAGIDQWRKNLGSMRRAAFSASQPGQVSSDARATQLIMDNFDRRITDAINNPNTFNGPQASVDAWNGARAAYADYRKTFTPQGRGDTAGQAMNKIVGNATSDPMEPNQIINRVMGQNGPAISKRLKSVLGDQSPEWSGVKQAVFQRLIRPGEGEADLGTAGQAQRLSKFLNGDLAKEVYTPQELGVLRGYGNLMRDITMPSGSFSPSEGAIVRLGQAMAQRMGGIVGATIGHFVSPFPLMGELAGYTLGKQTETAIAKRFNNLQSNFPIVANQMKAWSTAQQRAAMQPNPLTRRAAVGATAGLDKALAPFGFDTKSLSGPGAAAAEPDQQNVPGPVQQRQTGGRVDDKKKSTKTEARYRAGNTRHHCAICTMFVKPSSCSSVRGHISPYALCDFYEPKGNGERIVDNNYDVVTGANSSKKPTGPIFIDRHIPEWSPKLRTKNGKRVRLWTYLSIHEDDEQKHMEGGDSYDQAHKKATAAERKKAEADGVDFKAYTGEVDNYLACVEHERVGRKPPIALHVKPEAALKGEGHHHSSHKGA